MKMMILSDNHGRWKKVYDIVKEVRPTVDYIFHLGDSEFEQDDSIWELIDGAVEGNMDGNQYYPMEQIIDTPEGKVYLVHGHVQSVNRTNSSVIELAKERGANFVFHGHTHQLKSELIDDELLLVNPGSLNNSRGIHPYKTYAIVNVTNDEYEVTFYDEDMKLLEELTHTYPR